jgi:hypothetical protein
MKIAVSLSVAVIGVLALVVSQPKKVESQTDAPTAAPRSEISDSPRRLTITVRVQEPTDLKVSEGSRIQKGQVIADRKREKQRLQAQRSRLSLSLARLTAYQPSPPTPPRPVPAVKSLPPASYLEHEATVETAKVAIDSVESEIGTKNQEIAYLRGLPSVDPIIIEHEGAKLAELKRKHTTAVKEYQLAIAKLQAAKNQRDYQEYQASLETVKRAEESNATRASYERSFAEYQQRLADREFQTAQIQGKIQEVENAIASLSVVKSPYDGTIRRVKWLGQSPDGSLTAEITVMVRNGNTDR